VRGHVSKHSGPADRQPRHADERRQDTRDDIQGSGKPCGEQCDGRDLSAHQGPARDRQRAEDCGVSGIERQRLPGSERDERHDDQ
jgi:hypothetical protein